MKHVGREVALLAAQPLLEDEEDPVQDAVLAHEVLGGRDLLFLVAPRAAGGEDELSESEGRGGSEETSSVALHTVLPIPATAIAQGVPPRGT